MKNSVGSTLDEKDFIYDSSNVRRYRAICNKCKKDRGYVRKTTRHKMCMSCGQKGKRGPRLGQKCSLTTIEKLKEEQTRRLALKGLQKRSKEEKKMIHNLRSRLVQALKGIAKSTTTLNLLGCSIEELRTHLEKQFSEGMSWDNYGRNGWHVDHIKPLSSFDLLESEQQFKACHYSNLQPLWAEDNLRKSNKI